MRLIARLSSQYIQAIRKVSELCLSQQVPLKETLSHSKELALIAYRHIDVNINECKPIKLYSIGTYNVMVWVFVAVSRMASRLSVDYKFFKNKSQELQDYISNT